MRPYLLAAIATIAATIISVVGAGFFLGRKVDDGLRDVRRDLGGRLDDGLRDVRLEAERAHEAIGANIHKRTRRRRIQRIVREVRDR